MAQLRVSPSLWLASPASGIGRLGGGEKGCIEHLLLDGDVIILRSRREIIFGPGTEVTA